MKWHITKTCGEWWAVGITVRTFETFAEAVDWVESQRPTSEPCS